MNIRKLVTSWGFEVDDKALDKFEEKLGGLKLSVAALGAIAVSGAAALFGMAASTARARMESHYLGVELGLTTKELLAWKHAAELSGSTSEDLAGGLASLNNLAIQAAKGSQDAMLKFSMMGMTAFGDGGRIKKANELLLELSDRFKQLPNGMQRVQMASQMLGGNGLIPMLEKSRAELKAFHDEGANLVVGGKLFESSEEFERGMVRIKGIIINLRDTIGSQLMPVINEYVGQLVAWYRANEKVIKTDVTQFFSDLLPMVRQLLVVFMGAANAVLMLADALGGAAPALRLVVAALVGIGAASTISGIIALLPILNTLRLSILSIAAANGLATGGLSLLLGGAAVLAAGAAYYAMSPGGTASTANGPTKDVWTGSHALPSAMTSGHGDFNPYYHTVDNRQINVDARGAGEGVERKVKEVAHDAMRQMVTETGAQVTPSKVR